MQKFRKGLPETTNVYVCKNSLMRVATEADDDWKQLGEKMEVGPACARTQHAQHKHKQHCFCSVSCKPKARHAGACACI